VGGATYNNNPHAGGFKELGSKIKKNILSFVFINDSVNYLLNLSIPDVLFPALLSTLIRNRFQVKRATLLILI
jgi:hypothetical protein